MMRRRIMMETNQRCLGNLEHQGEFNPEEEQIGIDLYKGLDVYIEPLNNRKPVTKEYYEKIIQQFEKNLKERNELVHTLTDGMTKFEDDQMMFDFCKQYKEMFNDAEFNLYASSKDEDSDSDRVPDNDNNKKYDKEEPMADGKKKNENEKQSGIQKEKENIEDMSKGTEEGGSEANDDGEEDEDDVNNEHEFEKLTGDNREDVISMDVDNQKEEIIKENDGNETEDNENLNKNEIVSANITIFNLYDLFMF
ncbi:hypothetical protein Tco_0810219 [Tanacetum coccineum]